MTSILDMVNEARVRATTLGVAIECFLMTPETEDMLIDEIPVWNRVSDESAMPEVGGIPYRVLPNLMQCVKESIDMALKGKGGWILNTEGIPETGPAFE